MPGWAWLLIGTLVGFAFGILLCALLEMARGLHDWQQQQR
jgi:hypothetical protein